MTDRGSSAVAPWRAASALAVARVRPPSRAANGALAFATLLLLSGAAGCRARARSLEAFPRASGSQPAAEINPVVAPAQAGAVNTTVGAATGLSSAGDVAGIRVESVAPWGTIVLLGTVLMTALILSHRRELMRIRARCANWKPEAHNEQVGS